MGKAKAIKHVESSEIESSNIEEEVLETADSSFIPYSLETFKQDYKELKRLAAERIEAYETKINELDEILKEDTTKKSKRQPICDDLVNLVNDLFKGMVNEAEAMKNETQTEKAQPTKDCRKFETYDEAVVALEQDNEANACDTEVSTDDDTCSDSASSGISECKSEIEQTGTSYCPYYDFEHNETLKENVDAKAMK